MENKETNKSEKLIVAEIHDLLQQVTEEKISFSRMVEIINEKFQAVIVKRDRELKELKGKVIEYQEKVNQTMDNQVALIMQRDTTIEEQKKEIEEYEKETANLEKSIFQLVLNDDKKNNLLQECKLQLEYLNEKFGETGTTNSLLSKLKI